MIDTGAGIRLGVLGTGRVVAMGMFHPARGTPGMLPVAVASRTLEKARDFADRAGMRKAFGSYDAMLADTAIDAVYIALPTALHATWVARALAAGKHVLCEKPLAANATEAAHLVTAARASGSVLMEGLHVRHLRKLRRQREIIDSGVLGRPLHYRSTFRVSNVPMVDGDFRLRYELGGGAALDLGCYAAACLRAVAGAEPEVVSARCKTIAPQVDRWMRATVRFVGGATGTIECGFKGAYRTRIGVRVACERGWIDWHERGVAYRRDGKVTVEALPPEATYQLQMEAFAKCCRGGAPPFDIADSVATARLVDGMYLSAGLALRGTETPV